MSLQAKAAQYAAAMHEGQVRKYTGVPYIEHPIEVAQIIEQHLKNKISDDALEFMLAAALLHDVVEDTDATFGDILDGFGPEVLELVFWLTDVSLPGDGNRELRKGLDRWHIAGAPEAAQIIKIADLISNGRDIVANDKDFAKVYLAEKEAILTSFGNKFLNSNSPGLSIYLEAIKDLKKGKKALYKA